MHTGRKLRMTLLDPEKYMVWEHNLRVVEARMDREAQAVLHASIPKLDPPKWGGDGDSLRWG